MKFSNLSLLYNTFNPRLLLQLTCFNFFSQRSSLNEILNYLKSFVLYKRTYVFFRKESIVHYRGNVHSYP